MYCNSNLIVDVNLVMFMLYDEDGNGVLDKQVR
jgi:hypothetical protein